MVIKDQDVSSLLLGDLETYLKESMASEDKPTAAEKLLEDDKEASPVQIVADNADAIFQLLQLLAV